MNRLSLLFLGILLLTGACRRGQDDTPPKAVAVREDGLLDLRLMSFNIRYENTEDDGDHAWHRRLISAVHMIEREEPDVIGVQEALHGQAADLWASLSKYGFYGVGRDDGLTAGEYSGIFYRKDRFDVDSADQGTFWLSETPEIPGSHSWGNEIPRVVAWCRLIDRVSGRGFYIFDTHWDHRSQPSRERAALLIAKRIDVRARQNEPVVLLGDFNSLESNPAVAYLTGKTAKLAGKAETWSHGLLDVYQGLHPREVNRRTLHFWSDDPKGVVKVDHILVSRGGQLVTAGIVRGDKPMVSDHYPVTARVQFR